MAHYALIQDGAVNNICEWDGVTPHDPGHGLTLTPLCALPAGASIGWTQSPDGSWHAGTKPALPSTALPPPDARVVLAALGMTPDQIEAAIKHAGG